MTDIGKREREGRHSGGSLDLPSLLGALFLLGALLSVRMLAGAWEPTLVGAAKVGAVGSAGGPELALGPGVAGLSLLGLLVCFGLMGPKYPSVPIARWAPLPMAVMAGFGWAVGALSGDRALWRGACLAGWGAVVLVVFLHLFFFARAPVGPASEAGSARSRVSTWAEAPSNQLVSLALSFFLPLASLHLEAIVLRPAFLPGATLSDLSTVLVLQLLGPAPRPLAHSAMELANSAAAIPVILYTVPILVGACLLPSDLLFFSGIGLVGYLGLVDCDFLVSPRVWSRTWAWCDGSVMLLLLGIALFGLVLHLSRARSRARLERGEALGRALPCTGLGLRLPLPLTRLLRWAAAMLFFIVAPAAVLNWYQGALLAVPKSGNSLGLAWMALSPGAGLNSFQLFGLSWRPDQIADGYSVLIGLPALSIVWALPYLEPLVEYLVSMALFGALEGLAMRAYPGSWASTAWLSFLSAQIFWLGAALLLPIRPLLLQAPRARAMATPRELLHRHLSSAKSKEASREP